MSTRTSTRTLARLGALPFATAAITLSLVAPASAHVSASASSTAAGSYTVLTFSVPHGCDGSPTTKVEIQLPESVLSVTPTRNPFYDVRSTQQQLDEPVTDAHGNEITERTASVVYTATTPLPDGQRDTLELSFQVPDTAGEMVWFPTLQTCEKGETAWVEVPAEGQDEDELEAPAPGFEVTEAAAGSGHDHGDETAEDSADGTATEDADHDHEEAAAADAPATAADEDSSAALGWVGLGAGVLGLVAGGLALARTRATTPTDT